MKKALYVMLATLFSTMCFANPPAYEFPTISPVYSSYEATVIGTLPSVAAQLPEGNPLEMARITIFEDRVD